MSQTVLWGERGLVASFFLDLGADPDLGRWKTFLRPITFTEQGPGLDWDDLKVAWAVVEPSFGSAGFGSPDLIACLTFGSGAVAVLMLEAKLVPYALASRNWNRRGAKGYNSSLKGQLELNHRLAMAVSNYDGGQHLGEEEWVQHSEYRTSGVPRLVENPAVLAQLVEPLQHPGAKYLHVAVTTDRTNPLQNPAHPGLLPEIFLGPGGGNAWATESHRFGWINWERMEQMAQAGGWALSAPSFHLNHHYLRAKPTVPVDRPPDRPWSGVALVQVIPNDAGIPTDTALHFSWKGPGCALRDYSHADPGPGFRPQRPAYRRTSFIWAMIQEDRRRPFGRHPPRDDLIAWRELTRQQNREWDLS